MSAVAQAPDQAAHLSQQFRLVTTAAQAEGIAAAPFQGMECQDMANLGAVSSAELRRAGYLL